MDCNFYIRQIRILLDIWENIIHACKEVGINQYHMNVDAGLDIDRCLEIDRYEKKLIVYMLDNEEIDETICVFEVLEYNIIGGFRSIEKQTIKLDIDNFNIDKYTIIAKELLIKL